MHDGSKDKKSTSDLVVAYKCTQEYLYRKNSNFKKICSKKTFNVYIAFFQFGKHSEGIANSLSEGFYCYYKTPRPGKHLFLLTTLGSHFVTEGSR